MSINIKKLMLSKCCILALGMMFTSSSVYAGSYGLGSPASASDIAKIDIDVMPDGHGAPPGQGTYAQGKEVYLDNCSGCHGTDMAKPVKGTGAAALRGGRGTLASGKPKKTVESYWPYASTAFDFIKRAMPFNAPGSLSDNEVYAVVAYILAEGNIIDKNTTMNAKALANVKMPNRNGFISDPRPDVFNYD
jgi:cytochrome c